MATGYSLISALRQQKETHFSRYAMEWSLVMTLSLTLSLCLSLLSHLRLPPFVSVRLLWVKECLWWVMSVFTVLSLSAVRFVCFQHTSLFWYHLVLTLRLRGLGNMCVWIRYKHTAIFQEFSLYPLSLSFITHTH